MIQVVITLIIVILFTIIWVTIIKRAVDKRKEEFEQADYERVEDLVNHSKKTENNVDAPQHSSWGPRNGAVLYEPETCLKEYKSRVTANITMFTIFMALAVFFLVAKDGDFIQSRDLRQAVSDMYPYASILLFALSLVSAIGADRFRKSLPILTPQKLTVTSNEIVVHNGKRFIYATFDSIREVYAEYRKPSIKDGQFTDGILIIKLEEQTISLTCFPSAETVAKAINAILKQASIEIPYEADSRNSGIPYRDENDAQNYDGSRIKPTGAVFTPAVPSVESLMKRASLLLEDSDFKRADEYYDRILDIDAEYAPAYIGKLCAELGVCDESELHKLDVPINEMANYIKALRFSSSEYRDVVAGYCRRSNE